MSKPREIPEEIRELFKEYGKQGGRPKIKDPTPKQLQRREQNKRYRDRKAKRTGGQTDDKRD